MTEVTDVPPPPPRAFTQGVGTVFQFVGVGLFVISMFICCSSSLLSKDVATRSSLTTIGWHRTGDPADQPSFSAQRAITIALPVAVCYGMTLAAVGLGLQSDSRPAPTAAVAINALAIIFWLVQLVFFISLIWIVMSLLCLALMIVAGLLFMLSIGAWRDSHGPKEIQHAI